MTGYHERDNINIEEVLVSFASKTWLSQPLQFYASNMGWTGTNYESYDEGGVHLVTPLNLKNPERHCCQTLHLQVNFQPKVLWYFYDNLLIKFILFYMNSFSAFESYQN